MNFDTFLGLNVVAFFVSYFWLIFFRWFFEIIPHK